MKERNETGGVMDECEERVLMFERYSVCADANRSEQVGQACVLGDGDGGAKRLDT